MLRQLFDQAHLGVIDYADLFVWNTTYDGMHPDREAYKQVACRLAEDLQSQSNSQLSGR